MERHGIDWRDRNADGGVPVSRRFGDPFYSLDDGLAEAGHVFLAGNRLPERLGDGLRILEIGFGTGLNLLATLRLRAEVAPEAALAFTSLEAFPLDRDDAARALAAFPGIAELAPLLLDRWAALFAGPLDLLPGVTLEVIPGDARVTLPTWPGRADAVYLDGFSPARNPELWQPDFLAEVAAHMAPGATLATYSAAGHVRRALAAAGLAVERRQGYGRKRHMTVARKSA